MSAMLYAYIRKNVSVVTNDGRIIFGTLAGMDQHTNVILEGSKERVYQREKGVEEIELGHFIIRGDNIALVGLVDGELDGQLALENIKADPLTEIIH